MGPEAMPSRGEQAARVDEKRELATEEVVLRVV